MVLHSLRVVCQKRQRHVHPKLYEPSQPDIEPREVAV